MFWLKALPRFKFNCALLRASLTGSIATMAEFMHQPWFADIERSSARKAFHAGQAVALQDELSKHVGIILSGRAEAMTFDAQGEQTWLGEFTAGYFFGHMSLLTHKPIAFEITAKTDMSALIIPLSVINDHLNADVCLNRAVAIDLAVRLDTLMRRMTEALTLTAKGRVCAELVRMSSPIGISPDAHIIRPNPVFVDLALRVNSTRETVSRTVSELVKKGVVSRNVGALVIEHPDALKDWVR